MAVRRLSTQEDQFDPSLGITFGEPDPGSFNPDPTETPVTPPVTPPPTTPPPVNTPPSQTPGDLPDQRKREIGDAYRKYLGRDPQDYEYGWWMGNPNFDKEIGNSPEAVARAKGDTYRPTYTGFEGVDTTKLNDPTHNSPKYIAARILSAGGNVQQAAQAVGGTALDATRFRLPTGEIIDTRRDEEGANALQWLVTGGGKSGGSSGGGGLGAGFLSGLFSGLPSSFGRSGGEPSDYVVPPSDRSASASGASSNNTQVARAIEAARMPYEIARKSQLNNARAALADRGLLSEPGHQSGAEVGAVQRIEEGLAPAYTGAINDRLQQLDSLGLANLEQNRLWNQFLADYGLNRDRVRYDMERGNTDQYLQLLRIWLEAAQTAGNGFI